ncbi:MAG: DUF1648 domain-containing protein [Chloroflexota bacterium]
MQVAILTVFLLFAAGSAGALWWLLRRQQQASGKTRQESKPVLRWRYIILPVVITLASLAVTLYFYGRFPGEAAYHFGRDGKPDAWLSREQVLLWAVVPQFLLTLLSAGFVWGVAKLNILPQANAAGIKPEGMFTFMGNLVALPQLILLFAMLDIFSYNVFQTHLPLQMTLLATAGLATVGLAAFLILVVARVMRQARASKPKD